MDPLSEREMLVMYYASLGYTQNQTGIKMFLSENTIKSHRKHAILKLKAASVANGVAVIYSYFLAEARWLAEQSNAGRIKVLLWR